MNFVIAKSRNVSQLDFIVEMFPQVRKDTPTFVLLGSCHKRQKPQAPMPQAPIRNRQTRKVANAKGLNRNTNLT